MEDASMVGSEAQGQVLVIPCSGVGKVHGLISREAVYQVTDRLMPGQSDTVCLALTVDGCDKLCAKRGTEQYSGQVAASLAASDILGDRLAGCHRSARDYDKSDEEAVWILAERIAAEVDALVATVPQETAPEVLSAASCGCSCGSGSPDGKLKIQGRAVAVHGLPLIFDHLHKQGLRPGDDCARQLLETVRIYHDVQPGEEDFYRDALAVAYGEYCRRRKKPGAQEWT